MTTDHRHVYRLTALTPAEAERFRHPYYQAGSRVFYCVVPECLAFLSGNPTIDAKRLRRTSGETA